MKNNAHVRVKGHSIEMLFEWLDFDGDDCFKDFHVNVVNETNTQRFDFGPCAIHGLRKVCKFFKEITETTVSGGFRYPDVRSYDVQRIDDGYRVVIRFEGGGLHEQFYIPSPSVQVDDEFLEVY
jgi:hypothetical protein